MIKRVLISLDGSELAGQVVPHLLRFVVAGETEILLMTALPASAFPVFKDYVKSLTLEQVDTLNGGQACYQLEILEQELKEVGFKVQSQVLSGKPVKSILRLADETRVDLIAMSTHGRTGVGRLLLGSVADEVLSYTHVPIFLVPAKTEVKSDSSPRIIFLPLDGSPLAETAIPIACQFAKNTNAMIYLIRVVDSHDSGDESETMTISSTSIDDDYAGEKPIVRQAAAYLKRIQLRLQLAGVTSQCQVVEGEPAEAITRIAGEENADLIVMSTHGRRGVERQFYGSVASEVISHAIWPMLIMCGKISANAGERSVSAMPVTTYS